MNMLEKNITELIQDWIQNWDADWGQRPRAGVEGDSGSKPLSEKGHSMRKQARVE